MKKGLIAIVALSSFLFVVPLNIVAQEESSTPTDTSEESDTTDNSELKRDTIKQTMEERKAAREAAKAERLSEAEARRVANRCKAAQNKIGAALSRAAAVRSNRDGLYVRLSERIDAMISRLDTNGVDASTVSDAKAELDSMISDFFADFDTYQLAIEDAAALDCEADPDAFILALDDARDQRDSLKASSKAIRTYVSTDIRQVLKDLKDSLSPEDPTEPTDETDTDTSNTDGGA